MNKEKMCESLINVFLITHAIMKTIFVGETHTPDWEKKFRKSERIIREKTGLSDKKLKEVIEVFKQYEILERWGKNV